MAAMDGRRGKGDSMQRQRAAVLKIWDDKFRTYHSDIVKLLPEKFNDTPAKTLCTMNTFSRFAHYLTNVYKQASGEFLAVGTLTDYFWTSINMAKDQHNHNGSDSTKLFFTCLLGSGNEQSNWLFKL
jgi:hypothetical protein